MKQAQQIFPDRLFIAGTDTGVGKTLVSAILMVGLNGTYWKPVQSGLEDITDTEWIRQNTGLPEKHFRTETYRLTRALSPHLSAMYDRKRIDLEKFRVPEAGKSGYLIIEVAGGVMVPLNEECFMLDLIKKISIPVLLVAASTLGTINHTLLSLEQLYRHGVDVFGVVMNGPLNPENRRAIEYYGKTKVIAEIEPLVSISQESLKQAFGSFLDSFHK